MAIAAFVFDLDDTLYLERDYAFSGFAAVADAFEETLGNPTEAAARMRTLFDTDHRARVFNALLTECGWDESSKIETLVERMIEVYRAHSPSIALIPDADAALTRLRSQYKLGLITDGPPKQQWAKIDALNLRACSKRVDSNRAATVRERFDEIIVTGELGPGQSKPSPAAFELMADRLGVSHNECVYIADNPAKDFVGPNALGWTTIQINRPGGIYLDGQPAPGGRPNHQINSLEDLHSAL